MMTGTFVKAIRSGRSWHVIFLTLSWCQAVCWSQSFDAQSRKWHRKVIIVIAIFVRENISYSSVRELSYTINFRTARAMSHTLVCVHGFCMLLNFVLSAKRKKYTKLNRVRNFLQLQYSFYWFLIQFPWDSEHRWCHDDDVIVRCSNDLFDTTLMVMCKTHWGTEGWFWWS